MRRLMSFTVLSRLPVLAEYCLSRLPSSDSSCVAEVCVPLDFPFVFFRPFSPASRRVQRHLFLCVVVRYQATDGTCFLVTSASLPFRVLFFWIEKSPGVRWSSVNTEEDRVACRNLCLHAHSSACEQVGLSDSWCVRVVEQATNTVETLIRNYSSSSSSRNN